jgi:putative transposase
VKRVVVREVRVAYRVAERRACLVLGFARSSFRYRSRRNPRAELRIRLRDLATSRVHYGYQRLWVLLRREGWLVNKKLVYRLYCEEGLGIRRRKPRRRKSVQVREARPPTGRTNESWSMDFMADQLVGGQRFRMLTLVDNHSRESLAIEVGQRLIGDDVVRVLEQVTAQRGKPQSIRVDNGPEFISRSLDLWAYFNGVKLDFNRPGKPTDNAVIESFNGRLRDECLKQHWFLSLDEARAVTVAWREDYNRVRPHGALGNRTPSEFARPVAGHAQLPALHGQQPGWYQVGGGVNGSDDAMTPAQKPAGGRVALVTGASAGIGTAIAEEFAHRGYAVGIVGRDATRLHEVRRCIETAGGGVLVNVGSMMSRQAHGVSAAYVSCKGAMESLTYDLAALYGPVGIRVLTIAPGAIDTAMSSSPTNAPTNDGHTENPIRELSESMAMLGRLGRPEEVAKAVAWIASDEASYLTGTTLVLDGGWSRMHMPPAVTQAILKNAAGV